MVKPVEPCYRCEIQDKKVPSTEYLILVSKHKTTHLYLCDTCFELARNIFTDLLKKVN